MQVDDLDAAQTHRDLPVHLRRVAVTFPLRRPRKQGEFEAEHLLTHDGHRLQGEAGKGRKVLLFLILVLILVLLKLLLLFKLNQIKTIRHKTGHSAGDTNWSLSLFFSYQST